MTLTPKPHGFVLRVRTRAGVVTRTERMARSSDPRILALRPINARRGLEIMVLVDHGAANDFIVFYTMVAGRLVPMNGGPHDPADPRIVWDLGGTVGTAMSQADCVGGGRVGVILRWYHRGVWHQRLTLYEVHATRFR